MITITNIMPGNAESSCGRFLFQNRHLIDGQGPNAWYCFDSNDSDLGPYKTRKAAVKAASKLL